MTNSLKGFKVQTLHIMLAVVVAGAMTLLSVPAFAQAADYGYVNRSGIVAMFSADSANQALAFITNLGEHSGVMLLDSAADRNMVGKTVVGQ